jgi:hypothetical protein
MRGRPSFAPAALARAKPARTRSWIIGPALRCPQITPTFAPDLCMKIRARNQCPKKYAELSIYACDVTWSGAGQEAGRRPWRSGAPGCRPGGITNPQAALSHGGAIRRASVARAPGGQSSPHAPPARQPPARCEPPTTDPVGGCADRESGGGDMSNRTLGWRTTPDQRPGRRGRFAAATVPGLGQELAA